MKTKMKEKMKLKRLLSFLLILVMVVGMLPAMSMTALASYGLGTEQYPYIPKTYDELQDLMLNAPDYKTTYIKLNYNLVCSEATAGHELKLASANQSVVLDLNNYIISRSGTNSDYAVISLDTGNLIIRDSSKDGDGKIISNMTGGIGHYTIEVSGDGNLTIEGGTFWIKNGDYPAAIYTEGGTTQINGGTFRNMTKEGGAAAFEGGIVTVDGGTFIKDADEGTESYGMCINNIYFPDVTLCSCTVTGGSAEVIDLGTTIIPSGCSMSESTTADGQKVVTIAPKEGSSINTLSATVTKPVDGAFPDTNAIAGNDNYTATINKWYDSDSVVSPSNAMETGVTFDGKKTYVVEIKFTPNKGYVIRADRTVNINGATAYFCASKSTRGSVVYRAALTVPADIEQVAMTSNMITPGIGWEVTAPTFTVTEGNPVYVSNGKWQKYNDALSKWSDYSGETFEEGKYRYAAQLSLKSEDYENYLMNQDVVVTVDGKNWSVDNKSTWEESDKLIRCMAYSPEYTAATMYIVSFNANGGTGVMEDVITGESSYTLPDNGFTAPEGKYFKGWATSSNGTVISNPSISLETNTTLYAIWKIIKEYNIDVTDGKATVDGVEVSHAAEGTIVTLTASDSSEGNVFDKWVIESGSITLADANSTTTTFTMPASEVSVKATYKSTAHTHNYSDTWEKDADKHWKICECLEKSEEAAHTAGDWIVDKEATETAVGSKHKECSVCGYSMETAEIPAKGTTQTPKPAEAAPTPAADGTQQTPKPAEATPAPAAEGTPQADKPVEATSTPTPAPAAVGKVITDEKGSSYIVTKSGEVTFAKPKSSVKGTVTIPDTVTIDGVTYKVTAIEANAFKNNKNITKVIIGKNVTVIGNNAFSGCKKLKTITVKTTKLKSVGKKALKGIHAKAKIKVPKSKLKKYKSLFKNKGQGKNVKVSK